MLDIRNENIVSLNEAARALPRRRGGKKPHVATLYRWAQYGCRGVVLETCQIGGTKCTSLEALQRFVDRLSNATGTGLAVPALAPSRRAHLRRVEEELQREGL